jgi:phosphoenolpyruvate-protein kinase (PTS system EI component)
VPAPARTYLQGLAIGRPFTGPLHARRDLEDLLANPIPADAILAIPALTAQAAVALHALIIKAVCCEHGGAMSHAALMARELGLSALIGCRGCTSLPAGTRVHLDTRTARLRREIT